jgi:hypothetical protein
MIQANLLKIAPSNGGDELFEDILARPGLLVERIVSRGHITPPDQPYRQDRDEWVLLLEGNARLRLEGRTRSRWRQGPSADPGGHAPLGDPYRRPHHLAGPAYRESLTCTVFRRQDRQRTFPSCPASIGAFR